MVVDAEGEAVNAGVILNVPGDYPNAGEYARAAAARYASTFGPATKVSHDVPITVFEGGELIQQTS